MGGLALFAALTLLAALAPAGAVAATGSIAGTVTDAATLGGVEGARVCAWDVHEEEGFSSCANTATNGSYFIGGIQPGEYKVEFGSQGRFALQYYDAKASWLEADPVVVADGVAKDEIDAELQAAAAIEGTVTATEDGLGVEEVEVCAYPVEEAEHSFFECGYTESDGSYAINGLGPGKYKVEFWAGFTGRNLTYQFYDHKIRFAEADVLVLAEGESKAGVDADLQPGASITGNVSKLSSGQPLEEIRVCAIDATTGKLTVCTWTNEKGNYGVRLLSAGAYKVVFSPELWEFFPGEAFPGEDDDGYPTQFWSNQTTLAAASVLSLGVGGSAGAIDARLGPPGVTPPIVTRLIPKKLTKHPTKHPRKQCKRGFRHKKVRGKDRCVRAHKHRRRHHHKQAHRANRTVLRGEMPRAISR
jgi:hypothetical protein